MGSSNQPAKRGANIWVVVVIGVVLMFAGMYVSTNVKLGFVDSLAALGIHVDPGKTIAVLGVFLILLKVLEPFFFKPLADAIQERNSYLEAAFAEAESLRSEIRQTKADYETRLAQTEAAAREEIQRQVREAQELRQRLLAEATERAEQLVKRAQEQIEAERDRVLTDIRVKVADLALNATERILSENVDSARNRRIVEDFLSSVEVKN